MLLLLKSINLLIDKLLNILLKSEIIVISSNETSIDGRIRTVRGHKYVEDDRLSIEFTVVILNDSENNLFQWIDRSIRNGNFPCVNAGLLK